MRDKRVEILLTEAEVAALKAHPDYDGGKLNQHIRNLALRAVGVSPPDPYAEHKARPRGADGRMVARRKPASKTK